MGFQLELKTLQQWNKNTFFTEKDFKDCIKCSDYKCPFQLPSESCDRCSSSLPKTQSTVVLVKLCAAFHASSPMVILGYSQRDGSCKPLQHPIGAFISPYSLILLNQTQDGFEFNDEQCDFHGLELLENSSGSKVAACLI